MKVKFNIYVSAFGTHTRTFLTCIKEVPVLPEVGMEVGFEEFDYGESKVKNVYMGMLPDSLDVFIQCDLEEFINEEDFEKIISLLEKHYWFHKD